LKQRRSFIRQKEVRRIRGLFRRTVNCDPQGEHRYKLVGGKVKSKFNAGPRGKHNERGDYTKRRKNFGVG